MSTILLLLLSGALIGTGISLIWRDVHRKRRAAFVLQRDAQAEAPPQPDVEITIARPGDGPRSGTMKAGALPAAPAVAQPIAVALDASAVMQRWESLQSVFSVALRQVNVVLAAACVEVGALGRPSRSINGGYGADGRLLIAGENVGSLRLQVTMHDQVHVRVKAHGKEAAAIDASTSAPVRGMSAARASDLLSEVLKPAAAFAMEGAGSTDPERRSSGEAWETVGPIVASALDAANGALAQAGARFVALGPLSWNAGPRRHRMAVSVQVLQSEVARMHFERIGSEMEVAVGVPDARLVSLGRRHRIALQGMTTHALAELIASCAWPAIAHFRESRRLA